MVKIIIKFAPRKKQANVQSGSVKYWNFYLGRYSSGQRGQTVNLLFLTSQVRILLSPQRFFIRLRRKFTFLSDRMKKLWFGAPESGSPSDSEVILTKLAGVAQLVERQPSKLNVAGSNPVSRSKSFWRKKFNVNWILLKAESKGEKPVPMNIGKPGLPLWKGFQA